MTSNSISLKLDTKDLLRKLRGMPNKVQDKVIKSSVRKGANVVKNDAKQGAPKDTGLMISKIKVRQAKKRSRLGQFVMIVKVESPAHHLIELGTKDRYPTKSGMLKFEINGVEVYIKKVKGVTANPFLGRAYEGNREKVMETFKTELNKQISKL